MFFSVHNELWAPALKPPPLYVIADARDCSVGLLFSLEHILYPHNPGGLLLVFRCLQNIRDHMELTTVFAAITVLPAGCTL